MIIHNTAGLKIIILLIAITLTLSCNNSQEELVWHDFPEHPGYTQEEQMYYLKYFPTGFGKAYQFSLLHVARLPAPPPARNHAKKLDLL